MRIGYDMQALQTEGSRKRGIGRYSLNIVTNVLRLDSTNEYNLIFSNLYGIEDHGMFDAHNNVKKHVISYFERDIGQLNEVLQEFNYNRLNLDILHVLSPFEKYDDNTKAIILDDLKNINACLVTTLYDLIPLVFSEHYLQNPVIKKYYYNNLRYLYHSDLILSISEASKQDAVNLLGIPEARIINIQGGCSDSFYRIHDIPEEEKLSIFAKYGIKDKFILYTGGIDFRKNIERTIEAFAKIKPDLLREYKLLIVCSIQQEAKNHLSKVANKYSVGDQVIFTGYIPDEDLNLLYNTCDLFVFPSFYEGFGLPVVEAIKCGAPVIASNASSIPEIIGRKDCLFDPLCTEDISRHITKVLSSESLRRELSEYGLKRAKEFTWEKVAKRTLDAYKDLVKEYSPSKRVPFKKHRVAYFSPLPPCRSGIADYSAELLPFLSKYLNIDLFTDNYDVSDPYLKLNFNIYNYRRFEVVKRNYDFIIYHFGNSSFHVYMYDILIKYPGIVVLHDFFLSGFYAYMSMTLTGNVKLLHDEIVYSHGDLGVKYLEEEQQKKIDFEKILVDLPMNKRILRSALGVIVHSNWSKNKILSTYPFLSYKPVYLINQHVHTGTPRVDEQRIRQKYGIGRTTFVITSFGIVHKTKRLDICINMFSEFCKKHLDSVYVVVGELSDDCKKELDQLIDRLKIRDKIIFTGYVEKKVHDDYLTISDVCLNLRYPTRGETPRSLLKSLAAGVPTIVNEDAYFSELPDDVVIKVPIGEEQLIAKILERLHLDHAMRQTYSRNAEQYIRHNHSVDKVAWDYALAFHDLKMRLPYVSVDGAIEFISGRLKKLGIENLDESQMNHLASQIFNVFGEEKTSDQL